MQPRESGAVPLVAHGFLPFDEDHLTLLFGEEYAKLVIEEAEKWEQPSLAAESDKQNRPGYESTKANEFVDKPEVLASKVKILAKLITTSKNFTIYSGAGISTAAGLDDYASRAEQSLAIGGMPKVRSHFDTEPTLAHYCLTSLFKAGHIKHWVQQNHDGLPQKARFPQEHLNEIHGAWYDPSNPVIPMSGSLRDDLFSWLLKWEKKADFCLVVGTSMAGMNADRLAVKTARRCANRTAKDQLGIAIINLQRTPYDAESSLRIYGKIDDVMELLLKELGITPPTEDDKKIYSLPELSKEVSPEADVYILKHYDANGDKLTDPEGAEEGKRMVLDLREDAKVVLTRGMYKTHKGEATNRHREGHYRVRIFHPLKGTFMAPKIHTLGVWWIEAAIKGEVDYVPVVNCDESLRYL